MQMLLTVRLDEPLTLPIAHHHIMQGIIYSLMSDDDGYAKLHDEGPSYGNRQYKFFTFGPIEGRYQIRDKQITFTEEICFEVRVLDPDIIDTMLYNIRENGLRFGKRVFTDVEVGLADYEITEDDLTIQMISPICVYTTNAETGYTDYFNPQEQVFYNAVKQNFRRKYVAAFGKEPEGDIYLKPCRIGPKDRYLTRYKSIMIEAYKGTYYLIGRPEYLNFLYNTGLGAKNGQGFGMFEVVEGY